MITQEMKDNSISCKGKGFNCKTCKDASGCVDYVNPNVKPKPPLGIIPKNIWKLQRINELKGTIIRYYQAELEIPVEWIEEYNELIKVSRK